MSVLSFPRIYFKGYSSWDPCTFNNNDWQKFPTYDATNAALNWSFLATQNPPVTPQNFKETLRPYAITLQQDDIDSPAGPRVPAEWNMFGSHTVKFVQYNDKTTNITGGDLAYQKPSTGDPLIGAAISILGDQKSTAKLVDTNPASFWSSQIYYGGLSIGNETYSVSGSRAARMHSRWINMRRIYDSTARLTYPATKFGACFQACIPNNQIAWKSAGSPLLTAVQQASQQKGAQGVMLRFTAYVSMYFQNGIFNNTAQQPRSYEELAAYLAKAWKTWTDNHGSSADFFSQPCYSHVVGSIGVWHDGELASVPLGRYLSPVGHAVSPAGGGNPTALGPAAAQVDFQTNVLSIDLGSTIPELSVPESATCYLEKVNFGTLSIGLQYDGNVLPIANLDYPRYAKAAYEASAAIVDVPIPATITSAQLEQGLLTVHANGHTALAESSYCAQTDSRGIYLDQGESQEFQITVLKQGVPAAGALVLIAQYDSGLNLVPANAVPPVSRVNFTRGAQQTIGVGSIQTNITIVTADANGIATAGVSAVQPGFPVLFFMPFSGKALPAPPLGLAGPPYPTGPGPAFYATVRVLPFDDAVPQQFIDLWNSTRDQTLAWNFVYNQILYVYDMIFNFMQYIMNLGSQQSFEKHKDRIAALIAKPLAAESTAAMPVTRDLSQGKRTTLQLYLYLLNHNFNVPVLTINDAGEQ